jgi:aminoglycoside phosphotransferase (APT) family kinase protein
MIETVPHLDAILARLALPGRVLACARHGNGHINDTLKVVCSGGGIIVQRLNRRVFPDGAAVMGNIQRVLAHLATVEPDPGRRLALIPARDGSPWIEDADGWLWRAYPCVAARTIERVASPGQAWAAADAFARFLAQLAGLPGGPLATVIPGFHDTPARLARLATAVAADACGRRAGVAEELAWVAGLAEVAGTLHAGRAGGGLSDLATHNDSKINNLLFADDADAARCVIDLDTLMPGLPLYDFGDLVRTASCRAAEDGEPAAMVPDPELLAALVDGWLSGRGDRLQPAERALMPWAGAVITCETGVRFLTDHLEGDRYFRIHRPGHNRDRARAIDPGEEPRGRLRGDRRLRRRRRPPSSPGPPHRGRGRAVRTPAMTPPPDPRMPMAIALVPQPLACVHRGPGCRLAAGTPIVAGVGTRPEADLLAGQLAVVLGRHPEVVTEAASGTVAIRLLRDGGGPQPDEAMAVNLADLP